MSGYIVLTAIGKDKPGLVDEISSFLSDHNINIEDSRMSVLGGEFAIILLASGKKKDLDNFQAEIKNIEKNTKLSIQVKPTTAPDKRRLKPSIPHRLTVTSMDHPGIVHEVTHMLKQHFINIESLETHVSHAPLSGAPIFNMKCVINIPIEEKVRIIKKEMEVLEEKLNIDIEITAIEAY